ncbi:f-box domain cyclin-like [Diplodia corticola]|uniref:F-box domain cyclin-like n=1 Tax=Diplodia corticola TaxID=236234 RepID=A0A1J9R2J3_9PEZI|nr:f-box domain cyclin-like [Diplodia corticola]OJD34801.1 f-box domain cyclin-like [Diplodia corticola]
MDRLPPEILSLIVSFLADDPPETTSPSPSPSPYSPSNHSALAPYAPLSRPWQAAVEAVTFRRLRVQSTELAAFAARLGGNNSTDADARHAHAHRHRRAALAELRYEVLLPGYSTDRAAKFERRREREANAEVFGEAVRGLFGVLGGWEREAEDRDRDREEGQERDGGRGRGRGWSGGAGGRGIALHLGAYAVADVERPRALDGWRDLGARRYGKSVLRLPGEMMMMMLAGGGGDGGVDVPEVRRIVAFCTPGETTCTRKLRAASVAWIAARMPNLERVEWDLDDCAFAEDEVRHRYRKDFADALSTISNNHLTSFNLRLRLEDPQNDAFRMPSGTDPAAAAADPGVDELSTALHTFLSTASNLLSFKLALALSPAIFGPSPHNQPPTTTTNPKFPHLHHASIATGRTTPSGHWLYTRDPDPAAATNADDDELAAAAAADPRTAYSDYSSSADMTSWSSDVNAGLVDPDDSEWAETYHAWHDGVATGRRPRRRFRSRVDAGLLEGFLGRAAGAVMVRTEYMPRLRGLVVQVGEEVEGWGGHEGVERQVYWACFDDGGGGGGGGGKRRVEVVTLPGAGNEHPGWRPSEGLREMWEEWVGEEGKVEVSLCEDNY